MRIHFILALLCIVLLFLNSCLEVDTESRTLADEELELNELLTSLEENGYNVDTTDLGVFYIMQEVGEGATPVEGDTISISYEGYYVDGTMFDASAEWATDGLWEFVYGEQSLITGFHDGLSVMNKGSEVDLIIPSGLGYGQYGYGNIGAYQTLVFSVAMYDIKCCN